jgi:hypothetical protein
MRGKKKDSTLARDTVHPRISTDLSRITNFDHYNSKLQLPRMNNMTAAASSSSSASEAQTTKPTKFVTSSSSICAATDDYSMIPTHTPLPLANEAAHAVFSTNELLCSIVTHLPLNDIVVATGVCRTWRNALAMDLTIHRKLFFRPIEIHEVMAESDFVRNTEKPIPMDKCHVIGVYHPSIDKICGGVQAGAHGWLISDVHRFPRFDHEGSWREMFVTQPPCKSIT